MRTFPEFSRVFVLDHPLIQHKLTLMRASTCDTGAFRGLLDDISALMCCEVTRDLPLTTRTVETPLTTMEAPVLADDGAACIVPVLRAGLTMAEGFTRLMPWARVGHVGVYRDHETHRPVEYLVKLPPADSGVFIIVDPMLATGNSAIHAVDVVKRHGVGGERIKFVSLVAAPEGVQAFTTAHPEVPVYTAALDSHLNEKAYIVPGLGDAGDRLFGTS